MGELNTEVMSEEYESNLNQEIKKARALELNRIQRTKRRFRLLGLTGVTLFLVIWQAVVSFGLVDTKFLASPVDIILRLIEKVTEIKPDGALLQEHILSSLVVVVAGFSLGAVIGVPLGLFMGWYKLFERFVRSVFEMIRPIPAIAWIPIIILFLGINLEAKAVIIFISSFVPVLINSYTGIRLTNPVFINVAKTCGASNFRIFLKVGIPSALPMVFAGLRIGIGLSWSAVVAAEMLAARDGLGYLISMGRYLMQVDLILGGILVIGVLGLAFAGLFGLVENKVLKWRPEK